ncbi:hypothetical protein [Pseudomonas sp. PB101]|jgi:hypothetical protein|uniref:hypothetical protein n=1 Tax=Pseudomonas sp. PB101 TaxID=2495428 RepID=UPI00211497A1|nr:hypothetical protein [Pseudomonas sp. PB101]
MTALGRKGLSRLLQRFEERVENRARMVACEDEHAGRRLDETSWNTDQDNPYYRSKILSERAAWETAEACGLPRRRSTPYAPAIVCRAAHQKPCCC